MPKYQGVEVIGACQRLGHPCVRPKVFVECAEMFQARPAKRTLDIVGSKETYEYHVLGYDDPIAVAQALIDQAEPELFRGHEGEEARMTVARHFIEELPCHLDCPISICSGCGVQVTEHHYPCERSKR